MFAFVVAVRVDELIDEMLRETQMFDIALPLLPKRIALENAGQLLGARRSALEDDLDEMEDDLNTMAENDTNAMPPVTSQAEDGEIPSSSSRPPPPPPPQQQPPPPPPAAEAEAAGGQEKSGRGVGEPAVIEPISRCFALRARLRDGRSVGFRQDGTARACAWGAELSRFALAVMRASRRPGFVAEPVEIQDEVGAIARRAESGIGIGGASGITIGTAARNEVVNGIGGHGSRDHGSAIVETAGTATGAEMDVTVGAMSGVKAGGMGTDTRGEMEGGVRRDMMIDTAADGVRTRGRDASPPAHPRPTRTLPTPHRRAHLSECRHAGAPGGGWR